MGFEPRTGRHDGRRWPIGLHKVGVETPLFPLRNEYIPKKNRHSGSVPLHGVCVQSRVRGCHSTRIHVGTDTVHCGGFCRNPPDNSTPLSQIRKMSEVLDSATPKKGGGSCVLHVDLVQIADFRIWVTITDSVGSAWLGTGRSYRVGNSPPYPVMSSGRRGRRVGVEGGRQDHGRTQWHMCHVCTLGGRGGSGTEGRVCGCTAEGAGKGQKKSVQHPGFPSGHPPQY